MDMPSLFGFKNPSDDEDESDVDNDRVSRDEGSSESLCPMNHLVSLVHLSRQGLVP